ncbi:ZIP family metal transporter [Candidatus Roizmanbacteria bacterium CG02_land_8_20_14_3_00_36_15]|uniref:ZIP family metal transporter n=1 Tax=Candidatus Roizmanbacteria bacterium CG10_big_fil_rev_8_21_14_0_10_36_26 TaxID=1974851 RepID=A0A2M8KKN1_9BACT|nr:MAG: ZIP family metal transporter [Candidatus Roizmanbacteria bacterium CG03_land_8_20_14_0_80_36_21]PIV37555.1 MAG: ZIP family metal transporter [Candidatus Roizmanbacteria bacterium CG02_land_8_20_14_3_00_36_15]PIY70419.1 MAG: ZIP family metal transporter [Candidatus Roizmanbacteria bacterium CG_4_10_14_0_8_um_filter_36_36]PJE60464.1 MAG: ZIP family metal transporter [Candidatus Roizmanbacteria bacterium CG10_big_fil_rev_8_21_14_0_10_36_26]
MIQVWFYSLTSVFIVSLISLVGVFTLAIKEKKLREILIYFVSFSAGALFGDVFIHLLPEITKGSGFTITISLAVLAGIVISFLTEKIICWRHCHLPVTKTHVHQFAYMNLFGDAIHNFLDGITIAVSFLVSIPVGLATTLAVVFHEIPQEIGDFGVLLHGGFTKRRAVWYNFLTALSAVVGTIVTLTLSYYVKNLTPFLIPFAAGNFIYIAGSDLIPELHKEVALKKGLIQLMFFIFGIAIMMGILFFSE